MTVENLPVPSAIVVELTPGLTLEEELPRSELSGSRCERTGEDGHREALLDVGSDGTHAFSGVNALTAAGVCVEPPGAETV